MKKNVLSLALLAGMASAGYAAEQVSTSAPQVVAPATKAPAVMAPSVGGKGKPQNAPSATIADSKTESFKIPDIEKLTHGHYTQAHVDALVKNFIARSHQPLTPEVKEMIRNNLISQALVVQEAHRQGMAKHPEVKAQMDLVGDNILVGAFLADYFKHNPVTEADAKKEYDTLVAQNANQKEYETRHILVEKEEEAKQIIEQLKKGESFEKLAKEHSKDEGSKANGGDLGWAIPQETYVKPFAEAVIALEKGKFTQTPVKSKFGYHVIMLVDTRAAKAPEFEQVKAGIMEKLKAKKLEQYITGLRSKSK